MRPVAVLNTSAVHGTVGGIILSFVGFLDSNLGSADWEPRQVAIATAVILGVIRVTFADTYGVTWYSFIHGVVSAYFSAMAVWLSVFASVPLTGMSEPLRSITCQGPLTSLHRFVPAITMGYGLFDIFDGLSHGLDFVRVFVFGGSPNFFIVWFAHTFVFPNIYLYNMCTSAAPWLGDLFSDGVLL